MEFRHLHWPNQGVAAWNAYRLRQQWPGSSQYISQRAALPPRFEELNRAKARRPSAKELVRRSLPRW